MSGLRDDAERMSDNTAPHIYIHGTQPSEQDRLAALNRMTNRVFVQFLGISPHSRVLEVGSGLGLLAAEVASAADDVQVWGLERSTEQISAAIKTPLVTYIQGDAHHLDFPDVSFDLVYARYVLEHVSDPQRVLTEMRRVTRPGGRVAACENDVSLLRLDPPCPAFQNVFEMFQRRQALLGGDSLIGRRLYRLFRGAGFSHIELSLQPEVHWHGSPGFSDWMHNAIAIMEGAREGLVSSGLCADAEVTDAVAELAGLSTRDDASSLFVWNRASATR
jgi:ubiquinone/menaquinone biosynthesis C-methylase UbiE